MLKSAMKKKKKIYRVADGKAITSKRGILVAQEVREEDFTNGAETIKKFIKSGHIVESS